MKKFLIEKYKYIVFMVVLLVPFIYSFFYLKSYWNPYGNLEGLNVAIVNLDSAKNNSHSIDFIDSLKNSGSTKFTVLDEEKANKGLIDGKYYAVITIPKNFSSNLDNLDSKNRAVTTITYSPNQKANFLASQILNSMVNKIESNLDNDINSKIVGNLENNLLDVPDKIDEIVKNTDKIKDGSNSLNNGINTFNSGFQKLGGGVLSLDGGVKTITNGQTAVINGSKDLYDGSNKLINGTKSLQKGSNDLYNGITILNDGLNDLDKNYQEFDDNLEKVNMNMKDLNDGINALDNSMKQLDAGINSFTDNTSKLITLVNYCEIAKDENGGTTYNTPYNQNLKSTYGIDCSNIPALTSGLTNSKDTLTTSSGKITEGINEEKEGINAITDGVSSLGEASKKIRSGISEINTSSKKIEDGSLSLSNGIKDLNKGLTNLNTGANSLYNGTLKVGGGLSSLNSGINTLQAGTNSLSNGLNSLQAGSKSLTDGINTFQTTIKEKNNITKQELDNILGLDIYSKKPIVIKNKAYAKVDTYGQSFIPLFLSIGLWVGALISYLVFYYDQTRKFGILDSNNAGTKQDLIYLGVSVIYGFVTAFLLKQFLSFSVTNPWIYYLSSILISVTFMSLIQFLIRSFGDAGKFIVLVILVLQLASSGGTFPVETISNVFKVFTKYLPMTYSINLIKESVIKFSYSKALDNILILVLFALVSFILNQIIIYLKGKKDKKLINKEKIKRKERKKIDKKNKKLLTNFEN